MPLPIWLAHKLARRLALGASAPAAAVAVAGRQDPGGGRSRDRDGRTAGHPCVVEPAPAGEPQAALRDRTCACNAVGAGVRGRGVAAGRATHAVHEPRRAVPPGGPTVHAGLTGRKTAIDTYGEFARHSGAALSAARIRRASTAAGPTLPATPPRTSWPLAWRQRCEVQLALLHRPVAGRSACRSKPSARAVVPTRHGAARWWRTFDFRAGGDRPALQACATARTHQGGFYRRLAAYGQVGRMDSACRGNAPTRRRYWFLSRGLTEGGV